MLKIYDFGVLWSHLELEIQKSKRFGYAFSVICLTPSGESHEGIIRTLLATGIRMTDVTGKTEDGKYVILLNATREKGARTLLERMEKRSKDAFLRTDVTEYQEDDTAHSLCARVGV